MHGDFMAGIKCFFKQFQQTFLVYFLLPLHIPSTQLASMLRLKTDPGFPLSCAFCAYISHVLPCAVVFSISLLFHIICKFLKTTVEFYSYLLPLNIIWCLLLHRYLINHCAYSRTPFIIHSIGKGLNCPTLFRNMSNMKILEKR